MTIENRKIESSDLLEYSTYAKERRSIRKEVVQMKKNRRVELGPHSTFYFENFFTMKAQIQEMLYIEKGGDEQLKDELEAYNPLVPQGSELVATYMFEIDNPNTRKKVLSSLGNVENKLFISINGTKLYATPEEDVDRTDNSGKTSSVHFIHFKFSDKQIEEFKNASSGAVFIIQIKSGGQGLNLQEATRVYITAPAWNPATELQAIGRSHRTGQTQAVHVKKLVYKECPRFISVEEEMMALQGHKSIVCAEVLNDERIEKQIPVNRTSAKISILDIKKIFRA